MKVLLAGGSGLLGTALARSLISEGNVVRWLVRRPVRREDEIEWHPERGRLDPSALTGIDAAVCLSGAGVGDHRWTARYKRVLLASRTGPVGTLARAVATADHHPALVCASAVGYYGDTGERKVDESAPNGSGFLAELCREWEAAADPARQAGGRVIHLRSGVVLTGDGGVVARLRPIIKLGLGGRAGGGNQFVSWISLPDEMAAIIFALTSDLDGPINLTSPHPVRNRELVAVMAELLHRPAVLTVPAFALRLALGEFAEDTLTGQRAVPVRLLDAGFTFQHENLVDALRWALA